jgi:hypothetical protein
MTDKYIDYLNFMIENQEDIAEELAPVGKIPPWNNGYLEALRDCRAKYLEVIDEVV